MPDISSELEIIANEPKGRLVKKAIYDALDILNEAANRRPPAVLAVPVGEIISEVPGVMDCIVGTIQDGVLAKYAYTSVNAAATETSKKAQIDDMFLTGAGKLFMIAVDTWDNGNPPEINNLAGYSIDWTLFRTVQVRVNMTAVSPNVQFQSWVTSHGYTSTTFTIKGYCYSDDELPTTGMSDGDLYIVLNEVRFWDATQTQWITPTDLDGNPIFATVLMTGDFDEKRATIWTADITEETEVGSFVLDSDLENLTCIMVYDTPSMNVREEALRLCNYKLFGAYNFNYKGETSEYDQLPSEDVSTYDTYLALDTGYYWSWYNSTWNHIDPKFRVTGKTISVAYIKGKFTNTSELPETADEGDTYYISSNDTYYVYGEDGWYQNQNVYNSVTDAYDETDNPTGISRRPIKIMLCVGVEAKNGPHFVPESFNTTSMEPVTAGAATPSTTSAWIVDPNQVYLPEFKPNGRREDYAMLKNRSVSVIPIEIGNRSGGGS